METDLELESPPKSQNVYMVVHRGKLMTNQERTRRGFTANSHCQCCLITIEDLNHVFRNCSKANAVWLQLAKHETVVQAQHMTFQEWLKWNLNQTNVQGDGVSGKINLQSCYDGCGTGRMSPFSTRGNPL